ncbi:hypothetical protein ACM40_10020 [Chryseobacterium sp. BLS98]|uniref:GTP pyrophosphokinase n=1 Tax=Chryseobacterium sp. BLS98 TaxID=885586 RepID=UPI00065ABA27|nr:RelA/SpoT domain-containing protein [Chryseobacterium sp. BLS98]KMQ62600.1 hypothetical protein ACM40_10020 [Chryseobacterium sp. BLS98]
MKKPTSQELEIEYKDSHSKFERLHNSLIDQLNELLKTQNIKLGFPIQSRIKDYDSLLNKIENGRFNLKKSIFELQDIIGFRFILLFNKDISIIEKHIKENLNVIKKYNTSDKLLDNQFGYSSLHYIVKIPDTWANVPTFKGLENIQVEIQIRTISQHIWAEASNNLQYKNVESVPKEVSRSISRISALLETIDFEFDRLLIERDKYKQTVKNIENSEILNVDILENILDNKLPMLNKKKGEPFSQLIIDLKEFGVTTIKQLESLIAENYSQIMKNDLQMVQDLITSGETNERLSSGIYYSHVGLTREALFVKFGEDWTKYNTSRYKKR